MAWATGICRGFLSVIFLLAAVGKLEIPKKFLGTVMDFQILPDVLARLTAVTMPGVELAVGVVLAFAVLAPPTTRGWRETVHAAEWLAMLLTVAFTGVIAQALARDLRMDCGCFDLLARLDLVSKYFPSLRVTHITWWTVLRDVIFILPAGWLVRRQR